MINTSLIKLLKSLSLKELNEFEDFVKSPYFNKKQPVVNLFGYLKEFHPHFDDTEKLNRKYIYLQLYPGKTYNYGFMKNIIYDLNSLCENYLKFTNFSRNEPEQYRHLISELNDRKLESAYKKNLKRAELILHAAGRDDAYFRYKMEMELLKFSYQIKNISGTEKPDLTLQSNNYLVSYFLTKFFKINYNNFVHRRNFTSFGRIEFLEEVLNYVRDNPGIDPVINLYFYKFMLQYKDDDKTYREFKKHVKSQVKYLQRKEQYNTYINLLNYCYNKIASGNWDFYTELFDIYNEMLDNNTYTNSENDYLSSVIFRLAAETGVKLKKFDWTKNFIEQYSGMLHPEMKQNEVNIAYANYFLIKKDYDAAQNHIAQIHLNSAYDKVYVYIIQSMVHYETGQFENLISEVDSVRHFIANDKILGPDNRKSFQKYIMYVNELVKLNLREHADNEMQISGLKERLDNENSVLEKKWLIEKLDDLNGNKKI